MKIAALFSGGKDSSYSLYLCQRVGLDVSYLVTACAQETSYMYHVPAISASLVAAQSLGIDQIVFKPGLDDELTPLKDVLSGLDIDGVCSGAVASTYQYSRINKICYDLGIESITPLWHKDPELLLLEMIGNGFEIMITGVAAMGLDERYLGLVLGPDTFDSFMETCKKNRIHPGGEGGEYESLVLAGPHMRGRIELKYRKLWHGNHGEVEIVDVRLAEGKM